MGSGIKDAPDLLSAIQAMRNVSARVRVFTEGGKVYLDRREQGYTVDDLSNSGARVSWWYVQRDPKIEIAVYWIVS